MAAPLTTLLDQPRTLQICEMFGNSLLRQAKRSSQFAHRGRASRKSAEDRPPSWVGESGKRCAETIHNRMVVYSAGKVKGLFFRNFFVGLTCCAPFCLPLSRSPPHHPSSSPSFV